MHVSLVHRMIENGTLNKGIKVLLCMYFIEFKVKSLSKICYMVKGIYTVVIYIV